MCAPSINVRPPLILDSGLNIQAAQVLDRVERQNASVSAALLTLAGQSSSLGNASQLSFDSVNDQLSQLLGHVSKISAKLSGPLDLPKPVACQLNASADARDPAPQVVRVVQHAVQQYISRGRLKIDVIMLDSPDFRALSGSAKHMYARNLILFRLFIWMLRHPAVYPTLWRGTNEHVQSSIGRHAGLSFMWQRSTSLGNLDAALRDPIAWKIPLLPDLQYKQWLRYLLDCTGHGLVPAYGASSPTHLLSLICKFWDHIPHQSPGLDFHFVCQSIGDWECQIPMRACKFMQTRDEEIDPMIREAQVCDPRQATVETLSETSTAPRFLEPSSSC